MTMQSDQQGAGFVHTAGGEMVMLCAALAVIIVGAWFYVF